MKIASFVRNGRIDCGIVADGGFRSLDAHRVLGKIAPEQRLFSLLAMTPQERCVLADEVSETEMVAWEKVKLLAAVPLCPLYIYGHGNTPTIWLRQGRRDLADWREFQRVPYMRVRPFSSFSGDDTEVQVPGGTTVSGGGELGMVIGREAYRVPREQARAHIAGLVVLNDAYISGLHDEFLGETTTTVWIQDQGMATLYKAADCAASMGPWVTTSEEFEAVQSLRLHPQAIERYDEHDLAPWIYDRVMTTWVGGEMCDQSHSSAYLWGAEATVAYLSRFMRLRTGTVIGLGSAGWDGVPLRVPKTEGKTVGVSIDLSDAGTLHVQMRRMGRGNEKVSPFTVWRKSMSLNPVPPLRERPGRSFWVMRGNYRDCEVCEGVSLKMGMTPLCYPSQALGEGNEPLRLPPHAGLVQCSVQLAGVIGPDPVYRATAEQALSSLSHIVPVLGLRDTSLKEAIDQPNAYEQRAAYFLGCCGDGFFRMGPSVSLKAVGDLDEQTLSLRIPGIGEATYSTGDYLHSLAPMIAMISRLTTLLPGDVLSLGVAGPELAIPSETRAHSVEVSCSWADSFSVPIDDQRVSASLS